ncbi:hypothetical protein GF362_02940 [Candidatus Dojkabacteria bacterium]|nr:hypothetical protein [Candidatus Dojkabacteria bacterium]
MIELEKTYLAKYIPEDLSDSKYIEICDKYFPVNSTHPVLRLRRKNKKYLLTKKKPLSKHDSSKQKEETIILSQEEYKTFLAIPGRKIYKRRYFYEYNNKIAEFDVFLDKLKGLVTIDVEFQNEENKNRFKTPEFCLIEVTQEKFIAGGMLCRKSYKDIKNELENFNYKKLNYSFSRQ